MAWPFSGSNPPVNKVNLNPIPGGGNITNYDDAGDWNNLAQHDIDLKNYLTTPGNSFAGVVSITDPQFGAVAGGSASANRAAIQAALDYAYARSSNANGEYYAVFIPAGKFTIDASLHIEGTICLYGVGPMSWIGCTATNAPILLRNGAGSVNGPVRIEKLSLQAYFQQGGGGIKFADAVDCSDVTIRDVFFQCTGDCLYIGSTAGFSVSVERCKFLGAINTIDNLNHARGIVANVSGGSIEACNFQALDTAMQLSGDGVMIHGGRMEVNRYGIIYGVAPNGSVSQLSRTSVSSVQCEGNGIDHDVRALITSTIQASGSQGEFHPAPSSMGTAVALHSTHVLKIGYAQDCLFAGFGGAGDFDGSNIELSGAAFDNSFVGITGGNNQGYPVWNVKGPLSLNDFTNCPGLPDTTAAIRHVRASPSVQRALAGADSLRGSAPRQNLRRIGMVIAPGATSLDVYFPTVLTAGDASISSLTPSAGGSLTALGTYTYLATLVNEVGESTGITSTVTLTGSNRTITIAGFGIGSSGEWRRRLYRSIDGGATYQGGWDWGTIGSSPSFVDDGTVAFTFLRGPPDTAGALSCAEADTKYKIDPEFSFNCGGWWIVPAEKLTTGFKLRWATAAGATDFLSWSMVG